MVFTLSSRETSVKGFSEWTPGCSVGCMFITARALTESQGRVGVSRVYFYITYLSENKEESRRGRKMLVCESERGRERGRLLRIWQWPQCMDVCSWYDIWCDLNLHTNTHARTRAHKQPLTHAVRRRCAHTADSSSCSNSEALTAG